jgi:hypothetical protein
VAPVIEDPPFFEEINNPKGKTNGHGYTNGGYTNGHAIGSNEPSGGTVVFDRLAPLAITDIPPRRGPMAISCCSAAPRSLALSTAVARARLPSSSHCR